MSLNSVNTNMGAMVALQSLESTASELSATQKQISTGYRVADSTDDGAAYAIAQGIRSTVGALTSANQQLGNATGLMSTTQTGLNSVSNMMSSMRDTLIKRGQQRTGGPACGLCANLWNAAESRTVRHPGRLLQRENADRRHNG
jgi:flagellin-like hook-associated protein FlgL